MENDSLKMRAMTLFNSVKYYWKEPPRGKFMSFKEIAAYSFGGIGAYFLIMLGTNLCVGATNMFVGSSVGVQPMHMYILYVITMIANIPLTGIRANMVDNTRGKGGKYRPYIISMGIPTALIALAYVWFPYDTMYKLFPGMLFGQEKGYIIKCAMVLLFSLLLQFFFNFFNDAYTNLIHVLSPNTQERTDVLAIKSVVYSFAPTIMQIAMPLVAKYVANNDYYDIRVFRVSYPVFAILGIGLSIIVWANTEEKIVQAKTHTIQIRFTDALKEVAKNKYFWIIALAGWLGFLEGSYQQILQWSYTYGHTCEGGTMSLINTIIGNAALWGMILAPFCVKRFGKKNVLVFCNLMNVVCIALMLVRPQNIWWLFICVYFNFLFGSFEQITTPAIQADIRDYQQYKSGERIDGMFAAVLTIGNLVTMATSSVLPAVYEHYGIKEGNGYLGVNGREDIFAILDVTTGKEGLLYQVMNVLIIMAAVGAFLNVVPYFFYDFNEKKQKSVIRVLQVRALFEDYANKALKNRQIVEAIDMVENAREMAVATPKAASKESYKALSGDARKMAKKAYKEALVFNEEIEISKFVCNELDKYESALGLYKIAKYSEIYAQGLDYIKSLDLASVEAEIIEARAMPNTTEEEKEHRRFCIDLAKSKRSAKKAFDKYYGTVNDFVEPDMEALIALFDKEDELDAKIFDLAKNQNDKVGAKALMPEKKQAQKEAKALMDEFAKFNRAAKPYNDAKKLLRQEENYKHFDEIAALYEEAKAAADLEDKEAAERAEQKRLQEQAELEERKARKAAKKANKDK